MLSCDSDTLVSCIAGTRPVLEEKELVEGQKYIPYSDNINVEIENGQNIDYFISDIEIIEDLPNGIIYSVSGRTITFNGVPTEIGNFDFEIKITVRPYIYDEDGSDNLCSNGSSGNYIISIN